MKSHKKSKESQHAAILDDPISQRIIDFQVEKNSDPPSREKCSRKEWQERVRVVWTNLLQDFDPKEDMMIAFNILKRELKGHLSKIEYQEIEVEWENGIKSLERKMQAHKDANENGLLFLFNKPLTESLEISKKTLDYFYEAGLRLYDHHQFDEAMRVFQFITLLNGLGENVWMALGLCQIELSQFIEAIYSFGMAIWINPNDVLSHIFSAECYLELSEKNYARECLEKAQEILEKEQGYEKRQILSDRIRTLLLLC